MAERPEDRLRSVHRRELPTLDAALPRLKTRVAPRPTPENPLIVSASEVRDFLRCRTKWWWRHQCKLEPSDRPVALETGSLVHGIIDQYYQLPLKRRTPTVMKKLAQQYIADANSPLSDDGLELTRAMVEGYAAWSGGAHDQSDAAIGLERCSPEEWFELPLTKDGSIRLRGKIDNRFESTVHRKTMACLELKTAGQFRDSYVETNLQLSMYLWAMRIKYPGFRRYIAYYTRLRKQIPGPRVKAELFDRTPVERTDEEVQQWAIDMRRVAIDMLDAAIYPSPADDCQWSCDFQTPCLQRGNLDDLHHILSTAYRPKEYRP